MERFHVHAHVTDLKASIAFYSKLFAAEPTRVEVDYAKWMLEDPRINFAISTRGEAVGVDHLGIQTDDAEELAELKARAREADMALLDQGATSTGSPTRKASPGNSSSPSTKSRYLARAQGPPNRRLLPAACPPLAASLSALPSNLPPPAAEGNHLGRQDLQRAVHLYGKLRTLHSC